MSDTSETTTAAPASTQLDDLIAALVAAHADATPQVRYATAIRVTRSLIGNATSQEVHAPAPAPAPATPTSSFPIEQLIQLAVAGVRSYLGQSPPAYRARPAPSAPTAPAPTPSTRGARRTP